MRPALKPGLLWVWRDRDTLQIGIDSRRAIALTGMRDAAAVIGLLDGSRDRGQVIAAAAARGIEAAAADRVITLLMAAGALHDFPASTMATVPDDARARLAAELATAALAHGDGDGGARVLASRQKAAIRVHGTGPVGSCVASLLTAAGIGRVASVGALPSYRTTGPAADDRTMGLTAGRRRPRAPEGDGWQPPAARRTPSPRTRSLGGRLPDLAVLAGSHNPELASALVREGVPHLGASGREAIGIVGPLVIPGQSACMRCLDLARSDRDPAWPLILAQVSGQEPRPAACDAALATAVAAQAASQVLAYIDRATSASAVVDGTLELVLPGWQWHRRTWQPHPNCDCGSRRPR